MSEPSTPRRRETRSSDRSYSDRWPLGLKLAPPSLRAALFAAAVFGLGAPLAAHEPERTTPLRPPAAVFAGGPSELGMSEAELKERFGDALVPGRLSLTELPAPVRPTAHRLLTFYREIGTAELAYAEYELFDDRVFRIRWCLTERFDLPIYPYLLHQAGHRLSKPQVDELVGSEPHVPAALAPVLRHASWTWNGRSLELRQLEPLSGGTVFLTLSDQRLEQEAKAAREHPPHQPDRMKFFWERENTRLRIPPEAERWHLVWAFDDVLAPVAAALR